MTMEEKNKNMDTKSNKKLGIHQPYTTPPGFVPPTLGEQFRYFYKTHGHTYRYGYSLVLFTGMVALGYQALLGGGTRRQSEEGVPPPLTQKNYTHK